MDGLAEQLVAQGLAVRGAEWQGLKGSEHLQLNPVIGHSVLDKFKDLQRGNRKD